MAQFGHTGKMLSDKYLFNSEISCVKASQTMCFRKNNNGGSNREYESEHVNVINVFSDVDSILHMVTKIQPKTKP